jgi:hypothetical protein
MLRCAAEAEHDELVYTSTQPTVFNDDPDMPPLESFPFDDEVGYPPIAGGMAQLTGSNNSDETEHRAKRHKPLDFRSALIQTD